MVRHPIPQPAAVKPLLPFLLALPLAACTAPEGGHDGGSAQATPQAFCRLPSEPSLQPYENRAELLEASFVARFRMDGSNAGVRQTKRSGLAEFDRDAMALLQGTTCPGIPSANAGPRARPGIVQIPFSFRNRKPAPGR